MEATPSFRHSKRTPGIPGRPRRSPSIALPLIILLILLCSIGAFTVYMLTSRSVTLVFAGAPYNTRTYQSTVRGLLSEQGLIIHDQDIITPNADSALISGMTITVDRANTVIVEVDGKQQLVYTRETDPGKILNVTGTTLNSGDMLLVDNQPLHTEPYESTPHQITVLHQRPIQIIDNGQSTTFNTTSRTVGEALSEAGLVLYVADQIEPDPSALLTDNTITIKRSVPIRISADGHTFVTRTHGKTVVAALAEARIAPVGLDYITPDTSTLVTPNMEIKIVRVVEDDVIERIALPFKHSEQIDPTLPIDTHQVIQQGQNGVQELHVRIRREDGVEVSRSEPEYVIAQQPRDEITAVGTLPVVKKMDTPDGQINYWRVLKMRAASYMPSSAGKDANDPTYGITATGEKLKKGIVAVDPSIIPLGTRLYIPNYGIALAADTGGAVKGLVIDLGYSDNNYVAWSGEVEVYLLAPAPLPEDVPLIQENP